MSVHRYPLNRIVADYLLGGAGAAICAGLIALAPSAGYVDILLGGLTALFLLFTIHTAIRQRLRLAVEADGIEVRGRSVRALKWRELDGMTLRYYSTRRNRKGGGWMKLTLRAGDQRVAVDSYLDGFETLARRAGEAAAARGLTLDPATLSNFAALEITSPGRRA